MYGTGSADYDAQVGLQIAKNMTGRAQAAGDFTFTLTPVSDDAKALFGSDPVTYQNVAATLGATEDAANVSMGTVAVPLNHVFTLDDDGKSYEFTVAETGLRGHRGRRLCQRRPRLPRGHRGGRRRQGAC